MSAAYRITVLRRRPAPTDDIYILAPYRASPEAPAIRVIDTDSLLAGFLQRTLGRRPGAHLIVSRSLPARWIDFLERNRSLFGSIVYLFDDDFAAAAVSSGIPDRYRSRLTAIAEYEFPRLLALADHVVATSAWLADRYASAAPLVLHPPPCLPFADCGHHDRSEVIDICYFGTAVHHADLEMIAPALRRIHDEYPQTRLHIIVGRKHPPVLAGLPRVRFAPQLPWPKFKRFLQRQRAHILLAPLRDTPFNNAKSRIKFVEAAILGAAGIYSPRPPYREIVRHGANGLIAEDDADAWYESICALLQEPARAAALARAAQADARTGSPGQAAAFWRETIGNGPVPLRDSSA
jgi:glycosyltransferase involved in cell wall biosynthesis